MADDERDDPPLTVDSLADLQAGLHDDNTAARLRKQGPHRSGCPADHGRAEPGPR